MNYLRKLIATAALTCVLGVSAFAGCEQPIPGQINTPCDPSQTEALSPGQVQTPAASTTTAKEGTSTTSGTSVAEIAANVLISMLPLF